MRSINRLTSRNRRGSAIVYLAVALPVLCGILSLCVDYGLVQLTKTELQTAADAAARYAATGLDGGGPAVVRARAAAAAAQNKATLRSGDLQSAMRVEFGVWDASTRTFTPVPASEEASASALRVWMEFKQATNSSLTLSFARMIGKSNTDVVRSTVVTRGRTISPTVPGGACPWLAGMPTNATVNAYSDNPQNTTGEQFHPYRVPLSSFTSGDPLRFRQTTGTTSMVGYTNLPMDGKSDFIANQQACNGINSAKIPLGALVGIFLTDAAPTSGPMASSTDFSTPASRDFTQLSPQLKQVFFIGDGLNSSGQLQNFYPPAGATRLYLGIMDEKGWWWDNTGEIKTNLLDSTITTVK